MVCEDIVERMVDDVKEYSCNGVPMVRLIRLGDGFVVSIDAVDEWPFPVDDELTMGNVGLVYHRENLGEYTVEFVGYRNPSRVELISMRVWMRREPGIEELGSIVPQLLGKYAPRYSVAIGNMGGHH
jgi:hypothetical protein